MDARTLTALQGSIAKWEHVVDGTGADEGPDNCPLCQMFRSKCCLCPVDAKTEGGCSNPEWYAWIDHMIDRHDLERSVQCPECIKLAQAELTFLKSLLPEGEKKK